jgi:3-isopropylmalate/(R)-2-methylmalate dehydratase large subunit
MGKTLAEKILSSKSGTDVTSGDIVISPVDLAFVQDTTGPLTVREFLNNGFEKPANPSKTVLFIDHAAPSPNSQLSTDHITLRDFSQKTGCVLSDAGDGVCHQLVAENIAAPGDVIVGADSHTVTAGGLGAFATGMDSSDVAVAMALGKTWFRVPETIRIVCTRQFPKYVYAKDLILHLIGLIGADGATYKALEFAGETVDNMPIADRLTIANMAVEAGAKVGLFPSDEITREYLKAQGREDNYQPFAADSDAVYERTVNIDVSELEPTVSKPHTVDNTAPAKDLKGTKIQQVAIGTCTNGRIEDFEIAASILKGRKRHPSTRLLITPASRTILKQMIKKGYADILLDAGAIILPPGCGSCLGLLQGVMGDNEACL